MLAHWRKLAWLGAALLVLLAGDSVLTAMGPPRFVAVIVREWRKAGMPAVATAASFSVSAGSFATEPKAATFAAALQTSGLPILMRFRPDDPDGRRYQVLVGPYVSTDEAEHAQRALAAWGLGEPRLVVDDTMRTPATASVFGAGDESNGVVMIAAPGVSSVVFEMTGAPRSIDAKRTSATTIDVSVSGQLPAVSGQPDAFDALALPDGVSLVRDLAVSSDGAQASLRARLVVPADVESRVRLEGKRVYLDLAWPKAPWIISAARMSGTSAGRRLGAAESAATEADQARGQLAAARARFEEIEPFLASAADSDADVREALRRSLDALQASVEQLPPSDDRAALLANIEKSRP